MYVIKLWDKREVIVDDKTGVGIMKVIAAGRAEAITIKESMYKLNAIASVEKSYTHNFDKSKAITMGNKEDKRATTESEGYKKFQEMREKMLRK